jgi:hypothetical protein
MAKKEITPTNPETKVSDEVEDKDMTEAERKTAMFKVGRQTMGRVH